jgi:hypothetical protein
MVSHSALDALHNRGNRTPVIFKLFGAVVDFNLGPAAVLTINYPTEQKMAQLPGNLHSIGVNPRGLAPSCQLLFRTQGHKRWGTVQQFVLQHRSEFVVTIAFDC